MVLLEVLDIRSGLSLVHHYSDHIVAESYDSELKFSFESFEFSREANT